jgi:outer membrane lipoprotein-sorting protein
MRNVIRVVPPLRTVHFVMFAVLALVIAAGTLVAGNASADEKLPPRTAEQLLVDLQQADIDGFSGTVRQSADLGVPALPGVSEHGSDFSSLISGTHTLRVAYAAPDRSKVSLLGELSESSIIRNGDQVWTWSSRGNEVTHATIDPDEATADRPEDLPADAPKTPQEAAERILAAAAETTRITTDSDVTVADRAAYELVLRPTDTRSLISSVRIAVDGTEHVALQVQVFAGDRPNPVASIGFTEVDFAVPPAAEFEFAPPAGAKVTEVDRDDHADQGSTADRDAAEPTVVGEGWTSVVVSRLPADVLAEASPDAQGGEDGVDLQAYLAQLPEVSGSWGSGRLLAGTAFSVVVTDDGRVAAGAVPPELLYAALG